MQTELIAPKNRDELSALRRQCGIWLKDLREKAGLSQRELSNLVGIEYYTFISQIEAGRGKVPPERYEAYALALKVDPKEFVKEVLRFYEPITYEVLFGDRPYPDTKAANDGATSLDELARRLALIESKLSL